MVLISSPEYAHGVPGMLKNALDWVVGSGEFMEKRVALVNASAVSSFVTEQLRETLTVMMGHVVVAASPRRCRCRCRCRGVRLPPPMCLRKPTRRRRCAWR